MTSRVKILIADDSPTARQLLAAMVTTAPDMLVVGQARDGEEAVQQAEELRPDVILMDIVMPKMGGLEATQEIMRTVPTPIVMITGSLDGQETTTAFQALRRGALTVLQKPVGPMHPDYAAQSVALLSTVRAMAGVKVIHHRLLPDKPVLQQQIAPVVVAMPEIIAIAASTGGPAALCEIVKRLPADFNVPIVIVQHMSEDFLPSMVEWLGRYTVLHIGIAQENAKPQPGWIYFAPGGTHLHLTRLRRFKLDLTAGNTLYVPSGDILLHSVAASYGSQAVGVVLTGMGTDGARGLRELRDAGGFTIAQDQQTSVVYGMPQEAAALGAAKVVLPIQRIADALVEIGSQQRKEHAHE